jgi:hypothetical protein
VAGWTLLGTITAAAVLYGGAQAGIRSEWFRKAVEQHLSGATGMEVRVGEIRPTESLNLCIRNIRAQAAHASLEAMVMRVKWSFIAPRGLSRIRKLVVEDAVLTVVAPDGEAPLLPPTIAGGHAQELVSYLTHGRLQDIAAGSGGRPPDGKTADEIRRPHRQDGGIGHVRLVRGAFSLRDADGRERSSANGVEIDRTITFGRDGLRMEHWKVGAAMLASGGMRLSGLDWVAECTGDGPWNVVRFVSDDWADCSSSAPAEDIERATEQYRALLDAI